MEWDALDVATDGVFCDAFGESTDGYFCARRIVAFAGPSTPAGRRQQARDMRDVTDLLELLRSGIGALPA